MDESRPTPLHRVLTARRAFFQDGEIRDGLLDAAIYRSWSRCAAAARQEREKISYDIMARDHVSDLMDGNATLLRAARRPLDALTRAVTGAGYAVLLTDARGYALHGVCGDTLAARSMRQAFRQGVNLSEQAIGTSAMSCALTERRAVRVFGPEHYFIANQQFHCAAAPIIAPDGQVVGCVDITRDAPKIDPGALTLVRHCVQAIERDLFRRLPAYLLLSLSWTADGAGDQGDLLLAFAEDGSVLGLSEAARQFLGGEDAVADRFEALFADRFHDLATRLRRVERGVPVTLRSGMTLFASQGRAEGQTTDRHLANPRMPGSRETGKRPAPATPEFGDPVILRHIGQAGRALTHQLPILLVGETGVGKDVLARVLHDHSPRASGPFIPINCAALPENLIEGELFGHADGAFTGARRGGSPGLIEQADGGTLFLDEIGDMPAHLQSRLLRVLESREITRLGAARGRSVSFQLICATLRPVEHFIGSGQFREDLYYRISGYQFRVPALRERTDLPRLITALLTSLTDGRRTLSPAALARLASHPWPGNTRQLKHCLIRAHSLAEEDRALEPEDFPDLAPSAIAPSPMPGSRTGLLPRLEQQAIMQALADAGQDVTAAARLLGISRATLYRRLKRGN